MLAAFFFYILTKKIYSFLDKVDRNNIPQINLLIKNELKLFMLKSLY